MSFHSISYKDVRIIYIFFSNYCCWLFSTSLLDLLKLVVLLWFWKNVLPIHLSFLYFALFILWTKGCWHQCQYCSSITYQLISASVYHRDLKSKNILANANCKLKVCDFQKATVAFNDTPTIVFWTVFRPNILSVCFIPFQELCYIFCSLISKVLVTQGLMFSCLLISFL